MTRQAPSFVLLASAALLALAACGGRSDEAEPEPPPPPPDLSGVRVMIVPPRPGEPPALERELVFWLTDRGTAIDWVLPAEITGAVERNPASRFDLGAARQLVDIGGGELRIQDPLYGDLRRLSALLDASHAVVPMATRTRTDSLGVTVELAAVLVSVRGGRVLWAHTVSGGPAGAAGTAVAAAAAALARTLIPGEG